MFNLIHYHVGAVSKSDPTPPSCQFLIKQVVWRIAGRAAPINCSVEVISIRLGNERGATGPV